MKFSIKFSIKDSIVDLVTFAEEILKGGLSGRMT